MRQVLGWSCTHIDSALLPRIPLLVHTEKQPKSSPRMLWTPTSGAHRIRGLTAAHCGALRSAHNPQYQARQQRSSCSHRPAAIPQQRSWQTGSCVLTCNQTRSLITLAAAQQSEQARAAVAEDLLIVGALTCPALLHWHWQVQASPTMLSRWTEVCTPAGPGVLGSYVGKLWREQHPSAAVVGQTNTPNNHARCKHPARLRLSSAFLPPHKLARRDRALRPSRLSTLLLTCWPPASHSPF